MKSCGLCHKAKPVEEFKRRRSWCLECYRAKHLGYAKSPKGRLAAHRRNLAWQARFYRCKRQAGLRRIPFDLTREQYQAICDLPCTYCGYETKDTGHGLDRKDSKTGYFLENVVPACAMCNWAKNACFTYGEAFVLGKAIRRIRKRRSAE